MIFKLTPRIWWGSQHALAALPPEVKCVLGVGAPSRGCPLGETPVNVPEKIPYFRVAWPDHEQPPKDYFDTIYSVLTMVSHHQLFPILIHCRAGQMRSAVIAIIAAHLIERVPVAESVANAKRLRPDIMIGNEGKMMPYCVAALNWAVGLNYLSPPPA